MRSIPMLILALVAAVALFVPSGAAAQTAIDPVGEYDFRTTASGMTVTGTMVIEQGENGLTGRITSPEVGTLNLHNIQVDGQAFTFGFSGAAAEGTMRLELHGTHLVGRWEAGGDSGTVDGQKKPA